MPFLVALLLMSSCAAAFALDVPVNTQVITIVVDRHAYLSTKSSGTLSVTKVVHPTEKWEYWVGCF